MTPSLAVTDPNMRLAEKKKKKKTDGEKEKRSSDGDGEKEASLFLTLLCIFVRVSKVDATAALSALDDTLSAPHISRRSHSDTEWTPGFTAGRDFQDSESSFVYYSVL